MIDDKIIWDSSGFETNDVSANGHKGHFHLHRSDYSAQNHLVLLCYTISRFGVTFALTCSNVGLSEKIFSNICSKI